MNKQMNCSLTFQLRYRLDALIVTVKLRNTPLMVIFCFFFRSQSNLTRWLCSRVEPFNTRCVERRPDGCTRRPLTYTLIVLEPKFLVNKESANFNVLIERGRKVNSISPYNMNYTFLLKVLTIAATSLLKKWPCFRAEDKKRLS